MPIERSKDWQKGDGHPFESKSVDVPRISMLPICIDLLGPCTKVEMTLEETNLITMMMYVANVKGRLIDDYLCEVSQIEAIAKKYEKSDGWIADGYFFLFGSLSPKDGHPEYPVRSWLEVLTKICTSQ